MRFTDLPLDKFWISVKEDNLATHRKVMNILLQFSTQNMCEQAFSCLTSTKNKGINRFISGEDEIHVCLCQVRPRVE
jgi:hypothetical protein